MEQSKLPGPVWENRLKLGALLLAIAVVVPLAGMALRRGETSGAKNELRQIQSAVTILMAHNNLTSIPNPVTEATNDMGQFPDFLTPPQEKGLLAGDKPGYLLYGHDKAADGRAEDTVNYLTLPRTRWTYTVTWDGTVSQWGEVGR